MDEFPQVLRAWFTENEERLGSRGVAGDVQHSPEDGRPKSSTWLTVETGDHVAVQTAASVRVSYLISAAHRASRRRA
ncbi:hypothetical protein ACFYQ5_00375 [Streptomyces sp. NPDC005794]|uniref:hypothetical protein n=1 Tax=Streptomyces sp. NPDC005794 TaxID=3364733 RepID=UPI0036CF3B3B